MNILITGHKGFVGRHFVKYFSTNSKNNIVGIDIVDNQDCRDFFKTDESSKGHWDLVIHLAAIVGGRQTIESDPIAVAIDLSIDAELFNWAVRQRPKKIVYFSSSAAYPIALQTKSRRHKLLESDINLAKIAQPDLTYGWTKLTGELLAQFARDQYDLNVSVFRPFSGYGEDQDLSYPFPSFIQRGKQKQNPFIVWGNGTQTRDFIHIDDIVAATLKTLELNLQQPVNLGWGRPTSFNQLAKMVIKTSGYSTRLKHQLDKPIGVHYRVANPKLLFSFYQPKISLEEGIARALHV